MVINRIKVLQLLLLISFLHLFSACPSDDCDDLQDIRLKLLVDYRSLIDTFSVGDTLSIFSEFSDTIWDINNQRSIFVSDFNFSSVVIIRRFENGEQVEVNTQQNQLVNSDVDLNFFNTSIDIATGIDIIEHNYSDNMYHFSFDYILEKRGLYIIGTDALIGFSNSMNNQSVPGQCSDQGISAVYHRPNGNLDSNLEEYNFQMLEESGSNIYLGFDKEYFKEVAVYAFYVKE